MKIILIFIFLITMFCKEEKVVVANITDPKIIDGYRKVLEKNQEVHDILMKSHSTLPDLKGLIDSLEEAKLNSNEFGLNRSLEEEIRILKDIEPTNQQKLFEGLSRFSEHLYVSMKTGGVSIDGYNKFYCPMVTKYWISKGEEILNPYDESMRDCGELVR
jgi:hypothetical protein